MGLWTPDCDRKPRPQGICGYQGDAGPLVGREGVSLEGFVGHIGWGGASVTVDRIRGTVEVPPAVEGLHATRHPGHRDRLPGGGGYDAVYLPPGPLSGVHGTDPRDGYHWSAGKTGQDFPPQPNLDRGG